MARLHKTTHPDNDTIVAVITPPGEGGIAALRLAGPQTLPLLTRFFRPQNSEHAEPVPFMLRYGQFVSGENEFVDEVMAVYMPHGKSYTGLEQAEIFCHGGRQVVRIIQDELVAAGARIAEPGEFTKLAFLNGRIDLARAEAVAELIAANTKSSYAASREHLTGAYSEHVTRIREGIIGVISELEAAIDFPDEEIPPADLEKIQRQLDSASSQIKKLIDSYTTGRIIKEGFKVVIAGRPNAGKSSLFNLLLKHERALVNPIPGTTRDYLSEWVEIDGVAVNLIDTAGLRERGGKIERMGQLVSEEIIASSDLIVWVVDLSSRGWKEKLSQDLRKLSNKNIILVGNKIDAVRSMVAKLKAVMSTKMRPVSCKDGTAIHAFEMELGWQITSSLPDLTSGLVVTSARHRQKLSVALRELRAAKKKIASDEPLDLVAFDLKQAANAIDEIIGRVYTEQVLEQIFGKFCIGK